MNKSGKTHHTITTVSFFVTIAIIIIGIVFLGAPSIKNRAGNKKVVSSQPSAILKTANPNMSLGKENTPVRIVEYADLLCPYCAKFSQTVMPQIEKNYINTGKVHFEYRPVGVITADSPKAAEGAYCASDQNKFWKYYQAVYSTTWNDYYKYGKPASSIPIFRNQNDLNKIIAESGLNTSQFNSCLNSAKYASKVTANTFDFQQLGAQGTPYFLINNQTYDGYAAYSVFQAIINSFIQ